jgi:hypothetical protein
MQHCITEFKKIKNGDKCNQPSVFASRYTSQHVFNENKKLMLVDYVIKYSKLNYGMTHKPPRHLVYDDGRRLDCKFPSSWIDNKIVGIDGLQCFMKSHK